jgi:hypothetical protein
MTIGLSRTTIDYLGHCIGQVGVNLFWPRPWMGPSARGCAVREWAMGQFRYLACVCTVNSEDIEFIFYFLCFGIVLINIVISRLIF